MADVKRAVLEYGEVNIYNMGEVELHAYKTNDPLSDETFVLVKNGKAVIIEPPCFRDNISELADYIGLLKVNVEGKMVAYHAAGSSFLPEVKAYWTESAVKYNTSGGGKALVDNFAGIFGDAFDSGIIEISELIKGGKIKIADIEMNIVPNDDAYEIEIPEIKAVYIHMLGHDCHSIVAGEAHADAIIADIEGYLDRGFEMILTSHYTPETQKDARDKIAYLKDLKKIASGCGSAEQFKNEVQKRYPAYSGENYLDMTVGFFFPN